MEKIKNHGILTLIIDFVIEFHLLYNSTTKILNAIMMSKLRSNKEFIHIYNTQLINIELNLTCKIIINSFYIK